MACSLWLGRVALVPVLLGLSACSLLIDPSPQEPAFSDSGTLLDSGPPDAQVDAGCLGSGPLVCQGNDLLECEAGEVKTTRCEARCVDAACAPMHASNVPDFMFPPDRDEDIALESGGVLQFSTTTCESSFMRGDRVSQRVAGGPSVCVVSSKSFRLSVGTTLAVRGNFPLVILAEETVRIRGTLDVSANGDSAGPGGFPGGQVGMRLNGLGPGAGFGGGRQGIVGGDVFDGGGGGGALCGAGGAGGNAGGAGDGSAARGGEGGKPFNDAWELQPIFGGSGGARGQGPVADLAPAGGLGAGGAGGGALQISAGESIEVSGAILAGGGFGAAGSPSSDSSAGGGGGSGGAVLLEAPTVRVLGLISSAGGGGGGGASQGSAAEAGDNGRDAFLKQAEGGAGSGGGRGGRGGDGGGNPTLDGRAGGTGRVNGGGGGGSVGCIVLRARNATVEGEMFANPEGFPGFRILDLLF